MERLKSNTKLKTILRLFKTVHWDFIFASNVKGQKVLYIYE